MEMGSYLDIPITDKNSEQGTNDLVSWGLCSMQGWRKDMEDAHIAETIDLPGNTKGALFAVFDGHGGEMVAKLAADRFKPILEGQEEFKS